MFTSNIHFCVLMYNVSFIGHRTCKSIFTVHITGGVITKVGDIAKDEDVTKYKERHTVTSKFEQRKKDKEQEGEF